MVLIAGLNLLLGCFHKSFAVIIFSFHRSRSRVFANNATAIVALAVLDKRTVFVKNGMHISTTMVS